MSLESSARGFPDFTKVNFRTRHFSPLSWKIFPEIRHPFIFYRNLYVVFYTKKHVLIFIKTKINLHVSTKIFFDI